MKKIFIGFLGCGNIGGGVWRMLEDMHAEIKERDALDIEVKRVLVKDIEEALALNAAKGLEVPREKLTENAADVTDDGEISIVCEFMGGDRPAATFMKRALDSGKTVITANKVALALNWSELQEAAEKSGAGLWYEASVGGVIPVIRVLRGNLEADRIDRVMGIINGTTNYILTRMSKEGKDYADVLKEAQKLGLAEPNPEADVEGMDAGYKLSILASLAFHGRVTYSRIYREGISDISAKDIAFGREMGYTLKLLALAKQSAEGIQVRVHPTFIPRLHPLASVSGSFNSVFLSGDACDDMMLYGRGAGSAPTSSAVVSDMLAAARFDSPVYPAVDADRANTAILDNWESAFYIRLSAADRPGVLAHVAACLGERGVSIRYMVQRSETPSARVPIVLITHKAMEKDVRAALDAIAPENALVDNVIRVEE